MITAGIMQQESVIVDKTGSSHKASLFLRLKSIGLATSKMVIKFLADHQRAETHTYREIAYSIRKVIVIEGVEELSAVQGEISRKLIPHAFRAFRCRWNRPPAPHISPCPSQDSLDKQQKFFADWSLTYYCIQNRSFIYTTRRGNTMKDTVTQRAYTAIVEHFVKLGRAPHYTDLAGLLGVTIEEARQAQRKAAESSIGCWFVKDTDYVESWAPFSNVPTNYPATIKGEQRWYGQ
jgi:hypothetical protein